MADPITIAAVAAVGAAGVSAAGAIQSGQAAKSAAGFNAALAEQEAAQARGIATSEEARFRRDMRRLAGAQRAAAASQGQDPDTGSPLLLQSELAAEAELDALAIRFGGESQAIRAENEARLQRFQGSQAQTASFFQAGASVLSGVSSAGKILSARPAPSLGPVTRSLQISPAILNGDT